MDALMQAPVTLGPIRPTLAAGTTTTLSNTGTMAYSIRSKGYSHAAWSNQATPTTDINTGLAFTGVLRNKGSVFAVGINAAGTMVVAQGTIEALDVNGNFVNAPQFPGLPTDFALVGYIVIKAGATADNTTGWVFGTNNMTSVTGVTYAFVDAAMLPDRPQVA